MMPVSVLCALICLAVATPEVSAQDPALPGVCYATLGNNASSPGALITIDAGTGAGTLVGPTGIMGQFGDAGVPALAVKTTGEMYATDIGSASRLYRIDATTGAATLVATTSLDSPPAIAFNGFDILWAVDSAGNLYVVNDSTGATTLVGATGQFIKGLAFDPADGALWASNASGGVYTLDIHTGAATLVGNTGLPATPDLHFDIGGVLYGSSGGGIANNNLITIDKNTGQGAVVGAIGYASVAGMAQRLDRVVPVALYTYRARAIGEGVELSWSLVGIEGAVSFQITRSHEGGQAVRLPEAGIIERYGHYTLVDRTVVPGSSYDYRVVILENGDPVTSFAATVTTPALNVSLDQNHPNPFNPETTIRFTLDAAARVTFSIYDAKGRRVSTLLDETRGAGPHQVRWNGTDATGTQVSSGVYFYQMTAGNRVLSRRMVLLK
jgi:hypothetical protein